MRQLFLTTLLLASAMAVPAFAQTTPAPTPAPKIEKPEADFVFSEAPDDHAMGDTKAGITMIVYASVTCPHCSTWFAEDFPKVKSELIDTGKLRFILREMPTAPAQMSMIGFALAECAPAEDYWTVVLHQFEKQDDIFAAAKAGKGKEEYDKIAKMAGLADDAAISTCLNAPETVGHIVKNQVRADAAQIRGVPAFFVNGEPYDGDQSAKALIKVLSDMDASGVSTLPKTLPRPQISPKQPGDHSGHDH